MQISQRGIEAIKQHEGLRLHAYLDIAGVPTIGVGHTAGVKLGQHISEAQADAFLREDLKWVQDCIAETVLVPLSQTQYDALCSLIFNIGAGAFRDSTLRKLLNARDYEGAAEQFLRWNKARVGGVLREVAGLTARREAERKQFLSEAPPNSSVWTGPDRPAWMDSPPPPSGPPSAPRPDAEPYVQENPMPIPAIATSFLWELAKTAIGAFAPLAQEKITKEIGRHTNHPEIADQIAQVVVDTAVAATGVKDPVEAVVTAKKDPTIVKMMEEATLLTLNQLMPMLDKLHTWDQAAWSAEEESRRNADARAATAEKDQDEFLTRAIIALFVGLMLALAILIGVLIRLEADAGTVGTLVGLFAAAGGAIVGALNTRMQHRYGSSRGSAAKDVLAAELARRPKVL